MSERERERIVGAVEVCEGVSSLDMDTPERSQIGTPISKFEVRFCDPFVFSLLGELGLVFWFSWW